MEIKTTEFELALQSFKTELAKLRTGRANPAMIEDLRVDYYGTMMPIKQLANISVPEARQLLVLPWDKNALAALDKGIRDANLGFNPTNEGDKLRIKLPDLSQESRQELGKLAHKLAEDARIRIRNIREEIWKEVKKLTENGSLTEDDKFQKQEELQKLVDEHNQLIKNLAESKEKEIMTL